VGKELASRGYDCRWDVVSAAEVGAPHLRKRWFCLATDSRISRHGTQKKQVFAGRHSTFDLLRWSIEPSVGRVANGVPFRVDRIKCLGNAVVPAQARKAWEELSEHKP
jgi:DNA (cytosine-5)-methyltransferase 1